MGGGGRAAQVSPNLQSVKGGQHNQFFQAYLHCIVYKIQNLHCIVNKIQIHDLNIGRG